jgi:L-iditol 2-dehydrogenase
LACTVHGVLGTAGVRAGDNVAITGPGAIGLLALQLAKVAGASVIMIGTNQDLERLKLAKELGAEDVINVQQEGNISVRVADRFGGNGADVVIECSGAPPAANTLTDVACRGARFCQMGIYGMPILFDQDAVCYKELVVTGTNASVTPAWTRAVKLLGERKVDARRLITHRFSMADWDKALEVMKSKQGVKVILKPD